MNEFQEPKYGVKDGKIINRATGQVIPDDEPIFIMRAKDKNAALTLTFYKKLCNSAEHKETVNHRLHQFVDFALEHPERMKDPN